MAVSELAKQVAEQLGEVQLVDAHQHQGSWSSFGGLGLDRSLSPDEESRERLDFMDGWGMDYALIHPNQQSGSDAQLVAQFNDEVLAMQQASSARLIGSLAALPLGSVDDIVDEFARIERRAYCGLTFHHRFVGKPINHPFMDTVAELAETRNWPVVCHCVAESNMTAFWRICALADRHPNVRFLALTAFSGSTQSQQVLEVAGRYPNLFFETSLMMTVPNLLADVLNAAGEHRVLFGTDLYMLPRPIYRAPSTAFEILASDISSQAKSRILGENSLALFDLEVPASD